MSSIKTTQFFQEKHRFASRSWYYQFREIPSVFKEKGCEVAAQRLLQRYSKITKGWNVEKNSEWLCRLFLSAKLVMSATLHVNSMYFAEDRNLRVVVPYLRYYSVLSLLRAIYYTLPEAEWRGGDLIRIAHTKVINGAITHLARFDDSVASTVKAEVLELKAERELISYRAPSCGDGQISLKNRFLGTCRLLAEVAQFNSELFEASLENNAGNAVFSLSPEYFEKLSSVEIDGHYFGDTEDAYRLDWFARKHPRPANLMDLMTEGHVDDFFRAWSSPNNQDGVFNPHEQECIIFDIP
jgi:hypothetical protein